MQATLQLTGAYTLTPPSYPPSSAQQVGSPIGQTNYVKRWSAQTVDVTSDAATSIPLPGGSSQVHFVYVAVQGGSPVDLLLTSADGTSQVVPCDPLAIVYCNNRPVTAISVVRTPGVLATLTYLIAENQ